ncbi:LysM peptidoglycan-binding domain-containing protein [Georgenia sp. 10Sc9-8]|uniref:LysM peptidoglycan-binding domain-containing protein n=1 Tax=Georgenia halotolerans TaxID=3028317 RepID=A0ABT5TYV1_9MICO|nr:LysM peptidoglycan-binding domain-containing protein [Georgenia halotolerans]
MSSLAAHPARPTPLRAVPADEGRHARRRGHLQLVGPGYTPTTDAVPVSATPPLRLTRRGRRLVAAAGMIVGTAASVGVGAWAGHVASPPPASAGAVQGVTVEPGDTLWALAASVSEPGQDVRTTVADIVALNGLGSDDLVVGQRLRLPA